MNKSTLTLISIVCFLCMSISKAESKPSRSKIKKFIETFEDKFKQEHSTDADYIKTAYYVNSFKEINKVSEMFHNLEITRVGKGNKSFKAVEYFGKTAMHPDVWETVFYFVDGKLFCALKYWLIVDFNSAPFVYWTVLISDKYYFENDICTEQIQYRYSDRKDIGEAISKNVSEKKKINKNSNLSEKSKLVTEAYNWQNATNKTPEDEELKEMIETFENEFKHELNDTIRLSTLESIFATPTKKIVNASYILSAYYKNKKKIVNRTSRTFGDIEITRIGQGYLEHITIPITSPYTILTEITYPVFSETVYYFVNRKLFKAEKLESGTDYNFNPAAYWINIYSTVCYFENNKQTECKNYFQFGMTPLSGSKKQESESNYELFKNIDIIKEAYKLLNSDI